MLIIGSHVSYPNNLILAVEEALSYKANTFMFYTGSPTNTFRSIPKDADIKEAHTLMIENGIDINNVICHAPYIINLASKSDLDKYMFSINFLKSEIKRCEQLGVKYIVVHPGNAMGITKEEGCNNISEALNLILGNDDRVMVLLETMAGKGTECGCNTLELKNIIDGVNLKNKVGVCIDTCHLNDAGYDLNDFDYYLNEFDSLVGMNKIKCVHVNDSKNILGSHKDRHENIGLGTIGFDNLLKIIYHDKLKDIPKILETPYVSKEYPPYLFEIDMIKNKQFDNNLIDKIEAHYK